MGTREPLYDEIGGSYSTGRAADWRIAAAVRAALGDARSVVNVGAGTGAYEPDDLDVVAVEPSRVMIAQRPPGSAPAIQAHAERLPLDDDSADAALAVISDHHWTDRPAGLAEMVRVARRRVVLLNADPGVARGFWLTRDYLPGFLDLIPAPYREPGYWRDELASLLGGDVDFRPVAVPHDCRDGFYQAYWRRPHAYLDRRVRDNISVFHRLPGVVVERALERLRSDLDSGAWHRANEHLLSQPALDVGLRLAIAEIE